MDQYLKEIERRIEEARLKLERDINSEIKTIKSTVKTIHGHTDQIKDQRDWPSIIYSAAWGIVIVMAGYYYFFIYLAARLQ